MTADVSYILAMSCLIPAALGIYRFGKTDSRYHPFFYMMILDVLIETFIYIAGKYPGSGGIIQLSVNKYTFINFILFLYFTNTNGYLKKRWMQVLIALALLVSIVNFLYEHSIFKTFYYLLCFVSASMLIISIDILSRQTMAITYKLVNNCWFWFSSSSIIYNAFTLLIFGLYFFAMSNSPKAKAIGTIQHFANLFCYLLFTVAIWKIPEKK